MHAPTATINGAGRTVTASCHEVKCGEVHELPEGAAARRLKTGRIGLRNAIESDWQNDCARFAVDLKHELQQIEAADRRHEAIARMRDILVQYRDARAKRRHKQG